MPVVEQRLLNDVRLGSPLSGPLRGQVEALLVLSGGPVPRARPAESGPENNDGSDMRRTVALLLVSTRTDTDLMTAWQGSGDGAQMRPPKPVPSGARTLTDVLSGDIDPKVLAAGERIWAGFDQTTAPDDSRMQERLDAAPDLLAAVTAANSTPYEDLLRRPRRPRRQPRPEPSAASDIDGWNYRVFQQTGGSAGNDEETFRIGEAYYDTDGTVVAWAVPAEPAGSTLDDLRADLTHMLDATQHPVLDLDSLERDLPDQA